MIAVDLLTSSPRGTFHALRSRAAAGSAAVGLAAAVILAVGLLRFELSMDRQRKLVRLAAAAGLERAIQESGEARASALEARRKAAAHRIAMLDAFRANAWSARDLLTSVAFAVPDGLWLTEIAEQEKTVQIGGVATAIAVVARFVRALEESGAFPRGVEIRSVAAESVDERRAVFRFQIVAGAR